MRIAPATLADLAELLVARGEGVLSAWRWRVLTAQLGLSLAFTVHAVEVTGEDGAGAADGPRHPVAIGGIAPLPGQAGEIWLGAGPGLDRVMLRVVRATRTVLRRVAPAYPGGLMCLVAAGHRPGQRLARMIGCRPSGIAFGASEEWVWQSAGGVRWGS